MWIDASRWLMPAVVDLNEMSNSHGQSINLRAVLVDNRISDVRSQSIALSRAGLS